MVNTPDSAVLRTTEEIIAAWGMAQGTIYKTSPFFSSFTSENLG